MAEIQQVFDAQKAGKRTESIKEEEKG